VSHPGLHHTALSFGGKSNKSFDNQTVSSFQLVVASIANKFLKGSTNDSPEKDRPAFEQLPVLNNHSPAFEQLPVPNDGHAITTVTFLHLHVPFRTIGFHYSTKMMANNNDLHRSLLCPILLMNRVYKDGQAIIANVTTRLFYLFQPRQQS
jgi:hypothetical protein